MTTTIKLKLRERTDTLPIETGRVIAWMKLPEEDAKNLMYTYFEEFKDGDVMIHDKDFLITTINWVPLIEVPGRGRMEKGLPIMEQLEWNDLGRKVRAVDGSKDGAIELERSEITRILDRWRNDLFLTSSIIQRYWIADFITDFQRDVDEWLKPGFKPRDEKKEAERAMTERTRETVGEDGREGKATA